MEVGYLPDMFGHVAQMPQLLRQFGFEHAVVWRGVPESMTTTAFWWEAPDGSVVRAQYLPDGYSNGAVAARRRQGPGRPDPGASSTTYGSLAGDAGDGPLLWMNGTDHQMPRPWLGRVVAEANALSDDYAIRVGSLAGYLAEATTDGARPRRRVSCARGPGPTCSWAWARTGSTSTRPAPRASAPSSVWPSRSAPCGSPPSAGPGPCSTRPGWT